MYFEGEVVTPLLADETPENNTVLLQELVVGSFDPNDKKVEPNTNFSPEYLADGRKLTYTIRFQNTGTYHAEKVKVIDTISLNLNLSTIKVLASSHPVTWSITKNNILTFLYENINLPDSTANEKGSHGFIKFEIQPKQGLALGTPIDNTAHIYFDYNSAIVTNTVSTSFDHLVGTWLLPNAPNKLSIYPNPALDHVDLLLAEKVKGEGNVTIFDILGQSVLNQNIVSDNVPIGLEIRDLAAGKYLVKVSIKDKIFVGQMIVGKK